MYVCIALYMYIHTYIYIYTYIKQGGRSQRTVEAPTETGNKGH